MRPLLFPAAALFLAGCPASVGSAGPDNGWPPVLDQHADYTGSGAAVGEPLAPFELPDQHQQLVDSRQFLGFVTVIEVGATWCVPCQEAAQTQQAFHEQLQADPVWVLTVLMQDLGGGPPQPADSAEWAQTFGLELPVLADVVQQTHADWEIDAWPTTLVVAPDGTVLHRHELPVTEEQLAAEVAAALEAHAADLRRWP